MKCGLLPQDCAADHLAPATGARCTRAGRTWTGQCPACDGDGCLTLTVKGRKVLWHCNRRPTAARPACTQGAVQDALAAIAPGCIPPVSQPRGADKISRDELTGLLSLDDAALRLRVACLAWKLPAREAADKLGMSRRTYYRAVSGVPDMARNRRSP